MMSRKRKLKISRRQFIVASLLSSAGLVLQTRCRRAPATIPGGTLAPGDVAKYVLPLVKPPAMPGKFSKDKDEYQIAVRQFTQQVLSSPHPETTVWSYGSINHPGTVAEGGTFNYPAFTIEATRNKTTQVQWRNELIDANGNYLSHLLPVDPTLHWANPPGGLAGRDKRPTFTGTPGPYTGPVPIVTHVHGAHTAEDSDGYAEAWYLADAASIPADYARTGTFYDYFDAKYGHAWSPGTATFKYPNDQRATTLWYHDHTLGMTRLNVYAGPAGFYLIRGGPDNQVDGVLPGPAPGVGDDPLGTYYEIPIVIQDRSFNADGSLYYPDTREFFDEFTGPYIPDTSVSPIWNPEFFGNMMVVNGFTWPDLEVEQRRYRFRFLNGCNSRFLILEFDRTVPLWQIGTEGGFLQAPVNLNEVAGGQMLMGLAERADVIVDFTDIPVGTEIILLNLGPDEPFKGFNPDGTLADGKGGALDPADPASTGQVMRLRVVQRNGADNSTRPDQLVLPGFAGLDPAGLTPRVVSLHEEVYEPADVPSSALLGIGENQPKMWSDLITETPALGATEIWEIQNFTEDAHPIHLHQVMFQVLGRGADGTQPPEAWETGWKDTVIAYPGEKTQIIAKFDLPGFYVWHCHIVEHEDNEMMRPFHVGAIPPDAPAQ
jgi:FtsP/CotA-like multicopper oxidase with cupredoxin domain